MHGRVKYAAAKGEAANSLQWAYCMKWVHSTCERCSGQRQRVQHSYGRSVREETPPSVIPEEGLVVDGEKYDIVDSFCYPGDMLRAEGGADAAVTTRVRCAWGKFRGMAPFIKFKVSSMRMNGHVCMTCLEAACKCARHGQSWSRRWKGRRY